MASHQEKYDILGGKNSMVYMRITKNCMTTMKHRWVESHQTITGGDNIEGHRIIPHERLPNLLVYS